MRHFVEIQKFDLREGEEVMQVVRRIHDALTQQRQQTNKSLFLSGIFKNFVVARDMESGKLFKLTFKRNDEGDIELGEAAEVRQVYVPLQQEQNKGEDGGIPEDVVKAVLDVVGAGNESSFIDESEIKQSLWRGVV